jgi:O-antigen ligase
MSKLAERGPLLFFVISLGFDTYLRSSRSGFRRPLFVVLGLAVIAIGLYVGTELAPTRATAAGTYNLENNVDRTDLLVAGLNAFSERPLWGWGGGLVGRVVNGAEWWYVHCTYLDPLIDTGVAGTLVFWAMLILLAVGVRRTWVRLGPSNGFIATALPLYVLVSLEAQVSGTIWSTRHLWVITGVLAQLVPIGVRRRWAHAAGDTVAMTAPARA